MNLDDWLTDERAQEVIEKVHAVVNQETDRKGRPEAIRTICDTISTTQEGLDLAFTAGTYIMMTILTLQKQMSPKERVST